MDDFQGKIKGDFRGQIDDAQNTGRGELSTPRYCIFCETNTHDNGFSRIAKYTTDLITEQCKKHNACYMCFKTSEHKPSSVQR